MDSLFVVAVFLFLRFAGNEAARALPVQKDGRMRFPLALATRTAFRLAPPFAFFLASKSTEDAINLFDWGLVAVLILMGVAFLVAEPGEITASADGLAQWSFFGLQCRRIPWADAGALILPITREVVVTGAGGKSVVHSRYHVAQQQFVEELQRHQVPIVQGRAA